MKYPMKSPLGCHLKHHLDPHDISHSITKFSHSTWTFFRPKQPPLCLSRWVVGRFVDSALRAGEYFIEHLPKKYAFKEVINSITIIIPSFNHHDPIIQALLFH